MRRRGTVTVACIAACGLTTTLEPAASAVLTTALVPLITPRDGAISRAMNPIERNFLLVSTSGRYARSARSCGVTFEFQYLAPATDSSPVGAVVGESPPDISLYASMNPG